MRLLNYEKRMGNKLKAFEMFISFSIYTKDVMEYLFICSQENGNLQISARDLARKSGLFCRTVICCCALKQEGSNLGRWLADGKNTITYLY